MTGRCACGHTPHGKWCNGTGPCCALIFEEAQADKARDARATGPDPDKSTSARHLDEEQGHYRSF